MTTFEPQGSSHIAKLFGIEDDIFIEVLKDKEGLFWILEGEYKGPRQGWTFGNSQTFQKNQRGMSSEAFVGVLTEGSFREGIISSISYFEGYFTLEKREQETSFKSNLLDALIEVNGIEIRSQDDFS